jgi:beta-barrel assembly-enhancing protease
MNRPLCALLLLVPLASWGQRPARQTEVKIQKTSLSRDQEIQLGREAAAEVERTKEIVKNPEIEGWLNQIGQQLAKTPQANAYPFYFKLVNDEQINAFALPGGPMYVNTGLIRAADNEGEVAGVLAHEMSHVALRHGAAQLGKQQTWGTLFGALGAAAGIALGGGGQGECSMWCKAVQMGAGLGGNSVLLKFSRSYERDADLNGARMASSAGYDPMSLVTFFEKLEAKMGKAGEPKGLALWLSSHPGTGSRVQYVSEDIKFYPKRTYSAGTGKFPQVKALAASLPPPKPRPAAMLQQNENAARRANVPAGMKDYQAVGFAVAYPDTWQAGRAQNSDSLYLVPQGGVAKGTNGGVELLNGAMVDYYTPQNASDLDAATDELLQSLQKGDANLRPGRSERAEIDNKPARRVAITTKTSAGQDQAVELYTVMRQAGLWYIALAATADDVKPAFRDVVRWVQFPDENAR